MTDNPSAGLFKQATEALSSASSPAKDNLIRLLGEWDEVEANIKGLEEMLSSLNARKTELKTKSIPDAMAMLGSGEWQGDEPDEDGKVPKVVMDDFVSGSLPKDPAAREMAISWLEENGGGELLKTEISATFGKSEHNSALDVFGTLSKMAEEMGFQLTMDSGCHPQTYLAFMREKLKGGESVPVEKLGLFVGRVAKVSRVKAKKRMVK